MFGVEITKASDERRIIIGEDVYTGWSGSSIYVLQMSRHGV